MYKGSDKKKYNDIKDISGRFMFFLIFGMKDKVKPVEQSVFNCPYCRQRTEYVRYAVGEYFALYFIPLIKTGDKGEYVECQQCKGKFSPKILDQPQY
jgi:transcription elongation factor Elf1